MQRTDHMVWAVAVQYNNIMRRLLRCRSEPLSIHKLNVVWATPTTKTSQVRGSTTCSAPTEYKYDY